ncbi:MAG: L,D-transpeptidase family protein [bacterium]
MTSTTPRPTPIARHVLMLLVAAAALGACGKEVATVKHALRFRHHRQTATWKPAAPAAVKQVPIDEVKAAIAQELAGNTPAGVSDKVWTHTKALYASFGQTPLWLTSGGIEEGRARVLVNAMLKLPDDALRLDTYPVSELSVALSALKTGKATAQEFAAADVLLSAIYTGMGLDLLTGQVAPRTVGQAWHINPASDDVDSALVHSLGDTLEQGIAEMRPADPVYKQLQKELVRYRDIVEKGGWPLVPSGKTLHIGQAESPRRLAALRARLSAEGFEVASAVATPPDSAKRVTMSSATVYDAALAEVVGQYQARHAINVDKNLGPETVSSLNVPAAYRLGQIAANLERERWLPHTLGSRYVFVNVPAFQLTAFDSGERTLEMKVIVGQEFEDKATPVFSDSMETVVFRPYWNITPTIQKGEIEPKIAADRSYFDRENLEYYQDGGVRRIRQKPGPKNSLGFVKFLFPNDFNIYLHDTPSRELFDKDVRAFSHGCIRVQKPAELAQWALGWDEGQVQEAMGEGKDNVAVKLPAKIPVYIMYGTAFVRDGLLSFGNDLYHRDDTLVKAVASGAIPSAEARKRVEALLKLV